MKKACLDVRMIGKSLSKSVEHSFSSSHVSSFFPIDLLGITSLFVEIMLHLIITVWKREKSIFLYLSAFFLMCLPVLLWHALLKLSLVLISKDKRFHYIRSWDLIRPRI